MNILFLSHLSNNIFAGPNYSVPAGIKAQQEYDSCYWVNLTHAYQEHWGQVECFHNVEEFGVDGFSLEKLPLPFSTPDVVVFEGFYNQGLYDPLLAKRLKQKRVPYIIVPRGSLTRQAMNNHGSLKKRLAHLFFYDTYCKDALTIQYLTDQEYRDSYKLWNPSHIILPNGFNKPEVMKDSFSDNGIRVVYIGRPDKYHKGLDILWEAMRNVREELLQASVSLDFYAPIGKNDYSFLERQIVAYGLQGVVFMHDKIGGKEKEDALLASDLFIMTSRFEGHPMGLIEALAYGLPALVTPGTNMAKEIRESDAGWTCEGTVDGVTEALKQVIRERDSLSIKGRNAVLLAQKYNWSLIANDFHNLVQCLLKKEEHEI